MKTRTLLLLSLASGLAIMVAGAVFLFQLSTQDEVSAPVARGETVTVADMTVEVQASSEAGGIREVGIRIGGVDDPDGATDFRLVTSDRAIEYDPDPASSDDACRATTVEPATCVLRFPVADRDGATRVLVYSRGEERVRFALD